MSPPTEASTDTHAGIDMGINPAVLYHVLLEGVGKHAADKLMGALAAHLEPDTHDDTDQDTDEEGLAELVWYARDHTSGRQIADSSRRLRPNATAAYYTVAPTGAGWRTELVQERDGHPIFTEHLGEHPTEPAAQYAAACHEWGIGTERHWMSWDTTTRHTALIDTAELVRAGRDTDEEDYLTDDGQLRLEALTKAVCGEFTELVARHEPRAERRVIDCKWANDD